LDLASWSETVRSPKPTYQYRDGSRWSDDLLFSFSSSTAFWAESEDAKPTKAKPEGFLPNFKGRETLRLRSVLNTGIQRVIDSHLASDGSDKLSDLFFRSIKGEVTDVDLLH
jgi:hypothetical protein